MTAPGQTVWTELTGLPDELLALAERCLAADGGMPLATDPGFLGRRWAAPGVSAFGLVAADGSLAAAGAARLTPSGPFFTGLVDPAARGHGLGAALLDHGLSLAAGARAVAGPGKHAAVDDSAAAGGSSAEDGPLSAPGVTVETESLTEDAAALFESRGLRQVFAEDVMRIELGDSLPAPVEWPPDVTVVSWDGAVVQRFHATYHASFRDRPGFPGDPADEWIAENEDDDDFRPDSSLLVTVPGLGDAGFITTARDWVVQVGVVPAARRHGLAAALLLEALSRLRAAGSTHAWLTVNVNNPGAATLYRRLGFTDRGRRARYQP
ncbi:GNAT family N-acetyltransferase [Actinoplanes sp. Pm04-4]|uniref:GNAT family N-acetyltransferase n=1 Tax=Paractinoplanes pyxinae TaxID=2997416 RepID=A0ABT4AX09_9ACTN|nr:GNAT family N-acetyltransferase [Actinoplanes pyxinae]MCY1138771.1 GNAT family N-acetyltransferase [Actinoplanes pyxinae]